MTFGVAGIEISGLTVKALSSGEAALLVVYNNGWGYIMDVQPIQLELKLLKDNLHISLK